MELAKKIADRVILLTSLNREIEIKYTKKNSLYSIFTKSVAGEELNYVRMLENLKPEKRKAILETENSAEVIWKDLSRHLPYLQLLSAKAIRLYVKAAEQAAKDGTMRIWFSFDRHRLAAALERSKTDIRQAVMLMPYFEGNYFLHSLTSKRWGIWYQQGLPGELEKEENGQELLKAAGSRYLRRHKFFRKFNGMDVKNFLKMYIKYPACLELFDRVDEMSSGLSYTVKGTGFQVFGEIADYAFMIFAIKDIQERYEGNSAEELLDYLLLEIPRASRGVLTQFVRVIQDKEKTDTFLSLEPCMKTAFLKNRHDLLSVSEKQA